MPNRRDPKAAVVESSENERRELQRIVRMHNSLQAMALRCKIVSANQILENFTKNLQLLSRPAH